MLKAISGVIFVDDSGSPIDPATAGKVFVAVRVSFPQGNAFTVASCKDASALDFLARASSASIIASGTEIECRAAVGAQLNAGTTLGIKGESLAFGALAARYAKHVEGRGRKAKATEVVNGATATEAPATEVAAS